MTTWHEVATGVGGAEADNGHRGTVTDQTCVLPASRGAADPHPPFRVAMDGTRPKSAPVAFTPTMRMVSLRHCSCTVEASAFATLGNRAAELHRRCVRDLRSWSAV